MTWLWLSLYFGLLPALAVCEDWHTVKAHKLALWALYWGIATFIIAAKITRFRMA